MFWEPPRGRAAVTRAAGHASRPPPADALRPTRACAGPAPLGGVRPCWLGGGPEPFPRLFQNFPQAVPADPGPSLGAQWARCRGSTSHGDIWPMRRVMTSPRSRERHFALHAVLAAKTGALGRSTTAGSPRPARRRCAATRWGTYYPIGGYRWKSRGRAFWSSGWPYAQIWPYAPRAARWTARATSRPRWPGRRPGSRCII